MLDKNDTNIVEFVKQNTSVSSKEIFDGLASQVSYATVKRLLTKLVADNLLITKGEGKARKYVISSVYDLFNPINVSKYFEQEIDVRKIKNSFSLSLIKDILSKVKLFTDDELKGLIKLHETYQANISQLTEFEANKELERLAIDLSWKSSQIEGNTYSLLETERLLKEKETASGKSKDDAVMLLNHKEAIDFIV